MKPNHRLAIRRMPRGERPPADCEAACGLAIRITYYSEIDGLALLDVSKYVHYRLTIKQSVTFINSFNHRFNQKKRSSGFYISCGNQDNSTKQKSHCSKIAPPRRSFFYLLFGISCSCDSIILFHYNFEYKTLTINLYLV